MPNPRFFTIAEKKRARILEAAVKTVAEKGLSADVASVIRLADIPRGSFYQYFDDMEDLIAYIVDVGRSNKEKYLADTLDGMKDMDSLDLFRLLLSKSLELALDETDMSRIMAHIYVSGERGKRYYQKEIEDTKRELARLIKRDIDMGRIRKGINAEEFAEILIMFSNEIIAGDLFVRKKPLVEIEAKCDHFFSIIRKGVE